MKIANKINVSFFIVVVILMGSLMFISYTAAKNSLEKAIYAHLTTTAQSRARHIETFLKMGEESVKQLSESIVIKRFLLADKKSEDYNQKLNDVKRRLKNTNEITKNAYEYFVLSKDGIIVASSTERDIGKNKSADPYFAGAKKDAFIKDAYISQDKQIKSLAFSAPVLGRKNTDFLGVVAAKVPMQEINKIVEDKTGLGETGEIYLVNRYGYMITPSRFIEDTFLKQKVDTKNIRKCFEDVKEFSAEPHKHEALLYTDYRGIKALGTHDHIHRMQWCLCAEIDEKEALAPLATTRILFIIGFCVTIAILWIVGTLVSGSITIPIHKLRKGTEIVGGGNLDYKVATDAKDEIGQLSRAFDQMTEDLKNTTTSIDKLNKEITERKRAEDALESSNRDLELAVSKLEEANRELKDFVYVASHDLREPLRKIYSFGELLKDSLEDKLDGDDKENLEFMIDGASRMTAMIEGLLTYSRVGTKRKQFGTVDLNEVVEQLEQLELARLLEETGGTIEITQPLPIVEADAVQMRQLLQNLIANGIKYRRKEVQPQIVISAKNIDGDKVRIKVKDNGIGIDDKYHEDIFKMFRRLHSREEYGGAGIGLAVCKRIVERHNGQIGVESNPGEETTFWFTLSPANEMAAVS